MKQLLVKLLKKLTRLPHLRAFSSYGDTAAGRELREVMKTHLTVANLKTVSAENFQKHITALPGQRDVEGEGFTGDAKMQRDFTIQFEWGHHHDFGTFQMKGTMSERHINILAAFAEEYGVKPKDFAGKRVLDIGCWTGGTTMLLAALGAEVHAVEEVKKYADCVEYMARAFGLINLTVERRSLYALDDPSFFDRYDYVLYSGVLYHVTDPTLSLRIAFNCLKDGGACLLETFSAPGEGSYCEYEGAYETYNRETGGKLRWGWNWYITSLECTRRMMMDVGFTVKKATLHEGNRLLALGIRERHVDMLRAGLAKPNIR